MKKLLMSSAVFAMLLVGCRDSEENLEDTDGQIDPPTEELEENDNNNDAAEAEDEASADTSDTEEPTENIIGALTDFEPVPREVYDETPMVYTDMDEFLDDDIFDDIYIEDDRSFLLTDDERILSLDSEHNQVWGDENRYRMQARLMVDDTQVYNPAHLQNVKVYDKATGDLNYEIPMPDDVEEISNLTIDDEAIYLIIGTLEDEEDTFARNFTLHKYNKATGEEIWSLPFDAVRLGGGRSTYYEITQNDELIFLVEEGEDKGEDYEEYRPILTARSKEDGSVVWTEDFGEKDIQLRQGLTHVTEDTVYVIDPDYTIYGFDMETGDPVTEFVYPGAVPGAMTPQPMFINDELLVWQDVTEDYHNMKAINLATGEELWTLELDWHFLVDYAMVDDVLYAFFGSIDYEAEDNTMVARMNPETGEILTLADLGNSISAKYNNYDARMGLTEHEGTLAYFFDNHLYVFSE